MDPMVGMIYLVPFNWAPQGYAICQGQVFNVNQYTALFSLVGAVYGGDGRTTFGVPNLQGRVPLGFGTSPVSGTTYTMGQAVGAEKATLTTGNLPVFAPAATFTPVTGAQSVTIPATTGNLGVSVTVNATTGLAASGTPSGTNNLLANNTAATAKVYGPASTSPVVPLGGTSATVTGTASTAASTVSINTVTGGTVTIAPIGGGQPVTTLPPALALNFIIALIGIYPDRP